MKKFDVVALGEILIDMTCVGKSDMGQTLFEQNPGGAPANVLTAVGRLGGNTALIGKVGTDMHGKFLIETLKKEKISTAGLIEDDSVFTTLAFVNIDEKGDRSFSFARKPGADTCIKTEEVNTELISSSKIFHVGSLSLTDEPARSATFFALEEAKKAGCTISYDPNYRAPLWKDEKTAVIGMRSILEYVDIIKISDEETKLLTGSQDVEDASKILYESGIKIVIVTKGKNGAHIRTKDGIIESAAVGGAPVDTTGAGDAFMGGFLWNVAKSGKKCEEFSLEEIKGFADFANKVAGFCVGRRGAINAMPFIHQI